ncbi:MAG: hypothetical protein KGJ84_06265 [Elusimicrobia bacterium]|nr:hypothetical protein [Elusimicrobiota bacterium]
MAGAISTPTAGVPFTAVVNLVDKYMNVYPNPLTLPSVSLNTSDPYDIDPGATPLNNGAGSVPLTVKLVSKSTGTVLTVVPDASPVCGSADSGPQNSVCLAGSPAAVSAAFKVYASTAVGLQVILPGETQRPGKCAAPGCRALTALEGAPGKDGVAGSYVVGGAQMSAVVYLVDAYFNPVTEIAPGPFQDTNPPAVMPTIQLGFPSEVHPSFAAPVAAALVLGSRSFGFTPLTASSTYTVLAATTAASASSWAPALSAPYPVYPGPAYDLRWSNLPSTATAGSAISSGTLSAYDFFNNLVSTGPNVYLKNVYFVAEPFAGVQAPSFQPANNVTFSTAPKPGVVDLNGFVTLKKAGSRYLQAFETGNAAVNSEVAPAVRPYITVVPAAPNAVQVNPLPVLNTLVSAGSLSSPGRQQITGQLTDAFANPITAATTVYLQVVAVSGATGYLALDYGAGPINVGTSTTVFTNATGVVGAGPAIYYYVSSRAGDSARVWVGTTTAPSSLAYSIGNQQNITDLLLTVGGVPSQIIFLSTPPAATVGINDVVGAGAALSIQRLDDFSNPTTQGNTAVTLDVVETAAHAALGYTQGLFGTVGDYGFRDASNSQFITGFTIVDGNTGVETPFRYHDRMSSYSGPAPSSNTFEGGRPGTWTLEVRVLGALKASTPLRMDPSVPVQLGFANPPFTQTAGRVVSPLGTLAAYRVKLADLFANPVVATQTVVVNLASPARLSSDVNDYAAFSVSSASFFGSRAAAPSFLAATTTVSIPLGQYQTTFYYLDTDASSRYGAGGGTKPVLALSAPGLTSSQQAVYIVPDAIDAIAITTGAGQALLAGATSQPFALETYDFYGNPSPLQSSQDPGPGFVELRLQSDSLGGVQFSTPSAGAFVSTTAIVDLPVGRSATSFYLIDTLLTAPGSTHTVSASGVTLGTLGWAVGRASYTVLPGLPVAITWATPSHRLIAGTTIQYELGVPTSTVVAAQLVDQYGNVTNSTQAYSIVYKSQGDQTFAGISANAAIPTGSTGTSGFWPDIFTGNLPVPIPPGQSQAPMYFWSRLAGGATIYAQAVLGSNVFPPIAQVHQITPAPAAYLALTHSFSPTNPLKVGVAGAITLTARDAFGNVAAGDAKNGNYFKDVVGFGSSGSTSAVVLLDLSHGTTYHVFLSTEAGVFTNMAVVDSYQEVLNVSATDYDSPAVFGFTNDGARTDIPTPPAVRSSGDVELAGVVLTPKDLSPGTPGSAKLTLNQGDGTSPGSPNPVAMMRLNLRVKATQPSALAANLRSLRVQSRPEGSLNNNRITEVGLWYDSNANGTFEPPPSGDLLIATAAYDNAGSWFFGNSTFSQTNIDVTNPVESLLLSADKNYFLTVRVASAGFALGELPASFGLRLPGPSNITLSPASQVGVALNNFAVYTATAMVQLQPAAINVLPIDINAWYQPTTTMTLTAYPYVQQNAPRVGVLRLDVWADAFTGVLSQITVNHAGSGNATAIDRVRLYLDTQSDQITVPGDRLFEPGIDKEIASAVFSTTTDQATLIIPSPNGVNGTVTTSTKTYFLAYDVAATAQPGKTHGLTLFSAGVVPQAGNGTVNAFNQFSSTQVPVLATADLVVLRDWNRNGVVSGSSTYPINGFITQNDSNAPIAKLTLGANSGAAQWTGLKLDRWLPSTVVNGGVYSAASAQPNKASDVRNIKVWLDVNGDGMFNASTDSLVSPANTVVHNFPTAPLAVPLYSTGPATGAEVVVTGILGMFPSDNPFPPSDTFNRLVLNDAQTDELQKEVVYCYGVDMVNNKYTNCERGQESTGLHAYSTGTILSGPARIPITSLVNGLGQPIPTADTDFFVTYDVDSLATTGQAVHLGLAIPATGYFQITSPKYMSTALIGLTPPAKSVSDVPKVVEYPDLVRVVSTDTIDPPIGPFLQQQSTVAVAVVNVQTDVADALWRWILVTATGTAAAGGAVGGDVDQVSLWYDANNSGVFNQSVDVLVGTGTFGNYAGNPVVAQVNMNVPRQIVTAARAAQPQRYFLAYHMAPGAQPTDPVTQAPRTLGAMILKTSLPTGDASSSDSPLLNAVSYPNSYDSASPLPFASKLRSIIPSPQVLSVRATPYFSSSSGTFPAPILTNPVLSQPVGTIESFWILSSTQGLASPAPGTTAYLVADGEIVGYTGFGPGAPTVTNVIRGALNTVPAAHSSGTYASPQISQGQINTAALRLDVWSSQFQVQLAGVHLNRLLPVGMNGDDADLTSIRAYKSLDGVFHRDPVSGQDVSDVVLGASTFGAPPETNGRVFVPINDSAIGSPGYALITSTPTTLYVAFDVSPAALFSYPTLNPPNEVTGVYAPDPTRFTLLPANAGHTAVFVGTSAVASPTFVLAPTINTVTADFTQLSGNFATQNQKNVAMLRVHVHTDRNTAIIQRLRLTRTGSAASLDSDVNVVKVWADSNANQLFDLADSTPGVNGDHPYLLSYGNDNFSTGTVTINLKKPILVGTAGSDFFVTYDISQFAAEGNQEGVAVQGLNDVTLQVPNLVAFSSPTFASNPPVTVKKVAANVTFGVNDIASSIAGVRQAQAQVGMLRFNLTTDVALAPWRAIRLERGGGSQDPSRPLGRNTDVKFVRVYKDINQNDALDSGDVNLSEVETTLAVAVSSTTTPPFDMVVASTRGFPLDNVGNPAGGRIFMNGAELMTFSSAPGCAFAVVPGLDNATGKPCLSIVSRGDQLGTGPTPFLNLSVGATARKVDVFDQTNDANVQTLVTLSADQYISPTAQAFFVAYDVGDAAVPNDLIGVTVRDPSWISLPRGDAVGQMLLTGITRSNALGTQTTSYPFVGGNVAISPITLKTSGFSSAPNGAGQGDTNVPVLQLSLQTNLNFVNIASIRLKQSGTFATSTVTYTGDGDASTIKVWLDNGSGVFNPSVDTLLGSVPFSLTGPFSSGTALVPLAVGNIPYLTVPTTPVVLFVTVDIGYTDRTAVATTGGAPTLGHTLGFQLQSFSDMLASNGGPLVAAPDAVLQPPIASKTLLVAPLTVPAVSISSALPPIIVTRAGPAIPAAAVGYPAYAKTDPTNCNNGKDPANPRNNVCLDSSKNPIPDFSRWLCPDGTPWCGNGACTTATCSSPPLIDVNGDGRPDNFSIGQSTRPDQVSLLGDGVPTRDLTGTGLLDVDINQDGIPDIVIFPPGSTKPQFRIGLDAADPGNLAKTAPDPGQGLAPTSWSPSAGQLSFNLPMIGTSGYYQVAVGRYYDDPISVTHKWSTVTVTGISGLSAAEYRTRSIGAPITSAVLGNLVLTVPNVARLTQSLSQNTTSFTVDNAASLRLPGLIYVGSEIMRAELAGSNTLSVVYQAGDPPPYTGRGLRGSAPIIHTSGEVVSDDAVILFAQYVSGTGSLSPAQSMFVYRVDPIPPTTPGAATPLEQGKPSYSVRWTPSTQPISGVAQYEVQERGGDPKDLASNVIWRTINIIPARLSTYNVGDPTYPGEAPRPPGNFYSYRTRAVSGAGVVSAWSPLTAAANSGMTSSIIAGVSNFPNPFDSRKGGNAGKTQITYTLNADSSVTIQIYDALGYLTKTIGCPAGSNGGTAGRNFVDWDGRNDAGILVSKGGYTARIKVKSPGGTATVIRKIGVIH